MPRRLTTLNQIEPHWRPWHRLARQRIPPSVMDWLGDTGSLTQRVQGHCPDAFQLRVESERRGRPLPGERLALSVRGGGFALIREVSLCCSDLPWVFARTLIPVSTLRGAARRLGNLKERPLGEVLFANRGARRGPVEVAELLPQHVLFQAAVARLEGAPVRLWARRTLFLVQGRPLLVNEVFLPGLAGCS